MFIPPPDTSHARPAFEIPHQEKSKALQAPDSTPPQVTWQEREVQGEGRGGRSSILGQIQELVAERNVLEKNEEGHEKELRQVMLASINGRIEEFKQQLQQEIEALNTVITNPSIRETDKKAYRDLIIKGQQELQEIRTLEKQPQELMGKISSLWQRINVKY